MIYNPPTTSQGLAAIILVSILKSRGLKVKIEDYVYSGEADYISSLNFDLLCHDIDDNLFV